MFHITFAQIGVFDWLSGRQKGSIFVKMFKNLLLRNHKEDEAAGIFFAILGRGPRAFQIGKISVVNH